MKKSNINKKIIAVGDLLDLMLSYSNESFAYKNLLNEALVDLFDPEVSRNIIVFKNLDTGELGYELYNGDSNVCVVKHKNKTKDEDQPWFMDKKEQSSLARALRARARSK